MRTHTKPRSLWRRLGARINLAVAIASEGRKVVIHVRTTLDRSRVRDILRARYAPPLIGLIRVSLRDFADPRRNQARPRVQAKKRPTGRLGILVVALARAQRVDRYPLEMTAELFEAGLIQFTDRGETPYFMLTEAGRALATKQRR